MFPLGFKRNNHTGLDTNLGATPIIWFQVFTAQLVSLDIQIPVEDRCLNPQISPEARLLGVPNTYSPGIWRILDVQGVVWVFLFLKVSVFGIG